MTCPISPETRRFCFKGSIEGKAQWGSGVTAGVLPGRERPKGLCVRGHISTT